MTSSSGVPFGTGYSAEPEPSFTGSAVPVSIPNAVAHTKGILGRLGGRGFRNGYISSTMSHNLGNQLFGLMESRGMKAQDLADAAAVRVGDVRSVLRGSFCGDIRILSKIAAVFDVALSARFVSFSQALYDLGYVPSFEEEVAPPDDGDQSERAGA
jgi:hypothetical protein